MVVDIEPDIKGITKSWAHTDMVNAELYIALSGYVMCRKDRQERRGGGVIMHINYSTQADEIQMKSVADCEEDIWCNITTTKTQHYRHSSTFLSIHCAVGKISASKY